jgi:hypothetical protein
LRASVSRVVAQQGNFGLGLNLDQKGLNSFLLIQVDLVEVGAVGSYSRPFADFSLN